MKKISLVVSLNFNPGHVSHLVASYRQMEELGYDSIYYVNDSFSSFLPPNERFVTESKGNAPKANVVIFLFPSQKNILEIWRQKKHGAKIIYIFHEPLAPMKVYRKAGFSYKYLAKLWVINQISRLTVKWSDAILLPSNKAVELYRTNSLYNNDNYHYLPLMYDDERKDELTQMERQYFSYIGTIAADHSYCEYLTFAKHAINENKLPGIKFLIATKNNVVRDSEMEKLLKSGRLEVIDGHPLTNDEINKCYASSYLVWNAYERTTQSGVLAKSFMFGTPVIVLRKNLSEFTEEGKEVVAIDDNNSFEQIIDAVSIIINRFDYYSQCCRTRFEKSFYYGIYNTRMKEILDEII